MKAYELLDRPERWCQGTYETPDGNQFCIVGALNKVYSRDLSNQKYDDLCQEIGHNYMALSQWNDAPERTWQEVHDLLKKLDI